MDQLLCMRVFARVVEHGSFARAAESLDLARPAATTAVARLEKRLGVRLLHRTTRRLSLTDEGRAFYEGCVRILEELAETEDSLSGARLAPRGRLRASIPNALERSAAAHWCAEAWAAASFRASRSRNRCCHTGDCSAAARASSDPPRDAVRR